MLTRKPWQHRNESRHARGYGREWERIRLVALERDQWLCKCDLCKASKTAPLAASQVDHIDPKARHGTDDLANLRSVSAACHKRITQEQFAKRKPRINLDGTPEGWAA